LACVLIHREKLRPSEAEVREYAESLWRKWVDSAEGREGSWDEEGNGSSGTGYGRLAASIVEMARSLELMASSMCFISAEFARAAGDEFDEGTFERAMEDAATAGRLAAEVAGPLAASAGEECLEPQSVDFGEDCLDSAARFAETAWGFALRVREFAPSAVQAGKPLAAQQLMLWAGEIATAGRCAGEAARLIMARRQRERMRRNRER